MNKKKTANIKIILIVVGLIIVGFITISQQISYNNMPIDDVISSKYANYSYSYVQVGDYYFVGGTSKINSSQLEIEIIFIDDNGKAQFTSNGLVRASDMLLGSGIENYWLHTQKYNGVAIAYLTNNSEEYFTALYMDGVDIEWKELRAGKVQYWVAILPDDISEYVLISSINNKEYTLNQENIVFENPFNENIDE